MANIKKIIHNWPEYGLTVYITFTRESDGYMLDNADGNYADTPADRYLYLTEHATIKGRYEVEENRQVWIDDRYIGAVKKQVEGTPDDDNDITIGDGEMFIKDDLEVVITSTLNANVIEISDDPTAADNLESQYDGTGIVGDTFPSTQSQLGGLANVGSAVNSPAESYVLTTGTESANTVAETQALDLVRHEHTDDVGAMDFYYQYKIGSGIPSRVQITGYLIGVNDDIDIFGFDWVASAWVQIGNIQGGALPNNTVNSFDMFVDMVGSGVNSGIVRVRPFQPSGLSSATFAVDQTFVSFNQTAEGYEGGAIWIDTNASNTNTVRGIDGTATNPVSTMTAANTLAALTNLNTFNISPGSSITFSSNQNNQVFMGASWTLNLNGKQIIGTKIVGASVSGPASGVGTAQFFENCTLNSIGHIKNTHIIECRIAGVQTVLEPGDFFFDRCSSAIAGTDTWIFDFGDGAGDTNLNWRNGSGGIQLESMGDTGLDTASVEGRGQIIEGTCTAGIVAVRGSFTTSGITNLTLVDAARYDSGTLVFLNWNEILKAPKYNVKNSAAKIMVELKENPGYEGGFIYIDTVGGETGDEAFINGTLDNAVDNITDANTIADFLNVHQFKVISGSSITFDASQLNQEFIGQSWELNLGSQNISGTLIFGAILTGDFIAPTTRPRFIKCDMDGISIVPCHMDQCSLSGDMTIIAAGSIFFHQCYAAITGIAAPSIDFGPAIGDTNIIMADYQDGIELKNMGQTGSDKINITGNGDIIINTNCVGGIIVIEGNFTLSGEVAFKAAGGIIIDAARFDINHNIPVISSGSAGEIPYGGEGPTECIVKNDKIGISRTLTGDYTAKRLFFGVKKDYGDDIYIMGDDAGGVNEIEITGHSYDSGTNKTSLVINLTNAQTNVPLDTYKAEVEARDPDGLSNQVTPLRFELEVAGQVITTI